MFLLGGWLIFCSAFLKNEIPILWGLVRFDGLSQDKLDNNRYILNYSKLFRGCDNLKALKLKIDSFYTKIEKSPPKVFIEFFDKALKNSNLMKKNLKQVVIELEENRELLNLFLSNHKLQELIIKAEGYRIIVLNHDIAKVTKIVKDNGFFVEF
jgi:hypothetical protein